jgi:hypothetical protein
MGSTSCSLPWDWLPSPQPPIVPHQQQHQHDVADDEEAELPVAHMANFALNLQDVCVCVCVCGGGGGGGGGLGAEGTSRHSVVLCIWQSTPRATQLPSVPQEQKSPPPPPPSPHPPTPAAPVALSAPPWPVRLPALRPRSSHAQPPATQPATARAQPPGWPQRRAAHQSLAELLAWRAPAHVVNRGGIERDLVCAQMFRRM